MSDAAEPAETKREIEILHAIEYPAARHTRLNSRSLTLKGWCFDYNGQPLRGMRARIGEREFTVKRKHARFAVGHIYADCADRELANFAGFAAELELPAGKSEVIIEYKTQDKKWHELERRSFETPRFRWPWQKTVETDHSYDAWVEQHDTLDDQDRTRIRAHIETFDPAKRPLLSVVMPVYNPPEKYLRMCLDSVVNQLYPHWEFCIADDKSPAPHVRKVLDEYAAGDPRIKVHYREQNGHISASSNSAIDLASGDFIVLLDHDDELPEHALYLVAHEILEHPDTDLIYSDEDKISEDGRRNDPYFKPDWNEDLFLSQNCISHLGVYRTSLIREIGGFQVGMEGSQDWDLAWRAIEKSAPERIRHIPHILYHWRTIEGSTALNLGEKPYAQIAGHRAVEAHLKRIGRDDVKMELTPEATFQLSWPLPDPAPSVTLIIPTRNFGHLLRPCIDTILELTDYPNYDIIVVDNESDEPETVALLDELKDHGSGKIRVLRVEGPFNYSKLNNTAVDATDSDFVALINNDIEANHSGWLREMVSQALRPDIGAVGAKLHFQEGLLQHAGVFLGYQDAAGHFFRGLPWSFYGHANRANMVQNITAVTAACLVIERKKYLEVGGLDDGTFAVAYNDVDFCLKLHTGGYRNLYTPFARLFHHESASRGAGEKTSGGKARAMDEISALNEKWGALIRNDPNYNPNLSLDSEQGELAFPPRRPEPWKA